MEEKMPTKIYRRKQGGGIAFSSPKDGESERLLLGIQICR
jgi:hypothetical protein